MYLGPCLTEDHALEAWSSGSVIVNDSGQKRPSAIPDDGIFI